MKALLKALTGKSWTMNFNALAIALFVVDVLSGTNLIKENPDFAVVLTAVGNILLRFKTKKAVSDK